MRLFFGTTVPGTLAQTVHRSTAEQLCAPYWRPAPLPQWHVTALFIGEREERNLPLLEQAADKIATATAAFTLINGRVVTMPKEAPSMLWVRFQPCEALTRLHLALADATGTEPSIYRPYWPHITMARAKAGSPVPVQGPEVLAEWTVDHITLFLSTSTARGSVHSPIRTWSLKGKDPTGRMVVV